VLRPGSISLSQLKAVVPTIQMGPSPTAPRVPGSTSRHYSPATPVNVVPSRRLETVMNEFTTNHEKVAVLAQRPPGTANPFMTWINAGIRPEVPEGEKWDAVRDRLRRSASAENIVTYDQDIAAWVADFGEEGGPPG
jgi:L-threonylcarbamoyladenylate synthase